MATKSAHLYDLRGLAFVRPSRSKGGGGKGDDDAAAARSGSSGRSSGSVERGLQRVAAMACDHMHSSSSSSSSARSRGALHRGEVGGRADDHGLMGGGDDDELAAANAALAAASHAAAAEVAGPGTRPVQLLFSDFRVTGPLGDGSADGSGCPSPTSSVAASPPYRLANYPILRCSSRFPLGPSPP